jgi:hypothetical protein
MILEGFERLTIKENPPKAMILEEFGRSASRRSLQKQ